MGGTVDWEGTARFHAQNAAYYANIVRDIGQAIGESAYTSDDGSVQQDPLAERVREIGVARFSRAQPLHEPLWQYFTFKHLPPHLQEISSPFADLASRIIANLPPNIERSVALRKLLEAKDCAVRAALYTPTLDEA